MYTDRYIFQNTYVYFFRRQKDAEFVRSRFDKWRQMNHHVVQVENYGFLIRNEHNKLFDSRGRLPDDIFNLNPGNNTAIPVEKYLTNL